MTSRSHNSTLRPWVSWHRLWRWPGRAGWFATWSATPGWAPTLGRLGWICWGESRSRIIRFPSKCNECNVIYCLLSICWRKPVKGSKHALAAKSETVARCMSGGELCRFQQIDTILPPAASGSKRELNKFSLFTCNLRSTEIISDHLRSSQLPSALKSWQELKIWGCSSCIQQSLAVFFRLFNLCKKLRP